MTAPAAALMFASEARWPFRLHRAELEACRAFLAGSGDRARTLRLFGHSGAGKSFLVRELMVQLADDDKDAVGVYVDVPPNDLEASAILDRLDRILSERRAPTRDAPSFVGRKAAKSWISAKSGSAKGVAYGYAASRDLTGQIPVAGPFIKALLPTSAPTISQTEDTAPLHFLMKRSRSKPVLLVVDNVQFLPFATREMLEVELRDAGPLLRLVLLERTVGLRRLNWMPPVPDTEVMDVVLGNVTLEDVRDLVREVMPAADDLPEVASTVFRRSQGNLKSVWFQLRLIAARRNHQESVATSYEDVIETLPPLDQTVLRFVVFTLGGMKISNLVSLLRATSLHAQADSVISAVTDLAALGLLALDGDPAERVDVEHELIAQIVTELTPEEDKLEFRAELISALAAVLEAGLPAEDEAVLYDRLVGIVTGVELRQTPSLLAHVVNYVQLQSEMDHHRYLAGLCRDSVCWDVLDTLPDTTVRCLLDSIQKSALFNFGLVATSRLRQSATIHHAVASLYEAKYLVQLFRYEEARSALERAQSLDESRVVAFNIMLNLTHDDEAAAVATAVLADTRTTTGSENDYVILRNSVHLFTPDKALEVVEAAIDGFVALGRSFGAATGLNNRGIVEVAGGTLRSAERSFDAALRQLAELDSSEIYQPLINLGGLALLEGKTGLARHFLSAARDAAPRSLMQDAALLDLNLLTLDLHDGSCSGSEALTRVSGVLDSARRTRDVRFIDVVTWQAASIATAAGDDPIPVSDRVARRRSNGRVPLEIFVSGQIEETPLEVSFFLSPNWRH